MTNPHVGHLGIFVSASVAKFEHRAILESLDEIEALAPGSYEMKIENPTGDPDGHKPDYLVMFEPREVSGIGKRRSPESAFDQVKKMSERNDAAYAMFVSPWVSAMSTPFSAEILRQTHPMRVSRMLFSDRFNPWMKMVQSWAHKIGESRVPLANDDPRILAERAAFDAVSEQIKSVRIFRDHARASAFEARFGETLDFKISDNDGSPRMGV